MILVYRYRVKSLTGLLNTQARACNFVWNFCNDRQKDALRFGRRWHTGFDLNKLTQGASRELGLHSGTVNAVCEQYAKSRAQKRRPYLRYRGRKTLGWVPLKGRELKREGDACFTSQVCSHCGALPDSRPKGNADLGIREWQCSACGCVHDRDTNAALNILRRGRATLAVGIPVL